MLQRTKPTAAFARRDGACRRRARRKERPSWLRGCAQTGSAGAVMEASGGYERSWAEALRAAGVEVVIVDPKRIKTEVLSTAPEFRLRAKFCLRSLSFVFQPHDFSPEDRRRKGLGRLLRRHVERNRQRRLLTVDFHLLRGLAPAAVED